MAKLLFTSPLVVSSDYDLVYTAEVWASLASGRAVALNPSLTSGSAVALNPRLFAFAGG